MRNLPFRQDKSPFEFLKRYDTSFFAIAMFIFFIGVANLYSGTQSDTATAMGTLYQRQMAIWAFAVCVGFCVSFVRIKSLYRYSYAIYFFNIVLLLLVLFLRRKRVWGPKDGL